MVRGPFQQRRQYALNACCHHCRACSALAAGGFECICTQSEVITFVQWTKLASKEATSVKDLHQTLQAVQRQTREDRSKDAFLVIHVGLLLIQGSELPPNHA
ncbi:hypothetical protein ATANTOWER_008771 [Ataeniobius toweri]|uniref:Uncharacterized protein n=1 Tax=Ataeniobius toweri TaxID=208326 RepID=A0ABU7AE15_9TELE|nr:hypothetical protein [Ataeniobius toweri]